MQSVTRRLVGLLALCLLAFLTACGVSGSSASDKAKPDKKIAAQVTGSAPFCDLTTVKAVQEWAQSGHLSTDLPLYRTGNTAREVPQYKCDYYDNMSNYTVTTTAEQPGSSLVFDYITKRYGDDEYYKTVDYANYRSYSTGLTKSELNQLKGARAILDTADRLVGVIFKVGNVIVTDEHDGPVGTEQMNTFISKQLVGLAAASK